MYADYQRLQVGLLTAEGLGPNEAAAQVARSRSDYPQDYRDNARLLRCYGEEMIRRACQDTSIEDANGIWQEWIRQSPGEVLEGCKEWWLGVAAMLPPNPTAGDAA